MKGEPMMNIKGLLEKEIQTEFEELGSMKVGTEEHKETVDTLAKLMDRAIEFEKFQSANEEKVKDREMDKDFKIMQMTEEKQDRLIKNCIAVAGIVLPIVVTIWGAKATFKFEEEGTITTTMGRGFINRLFPKK